jgi:putative transposase
VCMSRLLRKSMRLRADVWLPGHRVARELDLLIARRGRPKTIISEQWDRADWQRGRGWADQAQVG